MKMLLYVVCFAVGFISASDDFVDVAEGDRPFQVSLRLHDVVYNRDTHFCSGAILDSKWVVTAARCLYNKRSHRIRVMAGTISLDSTGSWHEVDKIIMNKNYRDVNVADDIGLLKLKGEFQFNNKISAISLPERSNPAGSICVVAGWGFLVANKISRNMQETNVTTMTTEECRKTDLGKYQNIRPITDKQICAYKQDGRSICMSDSGAPLIDDNKTLVGIASFDTLCSEGFPNVYLRVYDYKGWITSNMK